MTNGILTTKLKLIEPNESKEIAIENNLMLERANKFSIIPTVNVAEIYVGSKTPSYRNYLTSGIISEIIYYEPPSYEDITQEPLAPSYEDTIQKPSAPSYEEIEN